jgi:hypothetical protein
MSITLIFVAFFLPVLIVLIVLILLQNREKNDFLDIFYGMVFYVLGWTIWALIRIYDLTGFLAWSILLTAISYDIYALTLIVRTMMGKHCPSRVPIISLCGYVMAMLLTGKSFFVSIVIDLIILTIFHISIHFITPFLIYIFIRRTRYWLESDMTLISQESQVVNSLEIQPFFAGRTGGFREMRLDVDANKVWFAFPTVFKNAESYFDAIHPAAESNNWELWEVAPFKRIYKQRTGDPNALLITASKIILLYNPNNSEVTFHLERE